MSLIVSGDSPSFSGTYQGGVITSGTAQVTTSGTAIDFTGIPSWVKRITVVLNGVSTNGSSPLQVQVGAGAIATTGYQSCVGYGASAGQYTVSTSGLICESTATSLSGNTLQGSMTITLLGSNVWCEQCGFYATSNTTQQNGGGSVGLAGTLDRIRLTTVNGTDTFDAGSVNILYEG